MVSERIENKNNGKSTFRMSKRGVLEQLNYVNQHHFYSVETIMQLN